MRSFTSLSSTSDPPATRCDTQLTIPYGTVSALAEGWRPSSGYRCRLRAGLHGESRHWRVLTLGHGRRARSPQTAGCAALGAVRAGRSRSRQHYRSGQAERRGARRGQRVDGPGVGALAVVLPAVTDRYGRPRVGKHTQRAVDLLATRLQLLPATTDRSGRGWEPGSVGGRVASDAASARVREVNGGDETVPTVFVGSSPQVNPSPQWVRDHLNA